MIYVCDAIMGAGKSSAAITYMNSHPNDKFVYITPYLEEAARVKENCPSLDFVEPSNKIEEYNFRKLEHTAALLKKGRNITTTHQAFKTYSDDMLRDIHRQGYRLIIDENLEVLHRFECSEEDIEIAIRGGYIVEKDGVISLTGKPYYGKFYKELFDFLESRELIRVTEDSNDGQVVKLYYWVLPKDLVTSFKDVFILTYLFEGQGLSCFLQIYDLDFEYIGLQKSEDGVYSFGPAPGYVPEYVSHLKDMIHIVDKPRLNAIGEEPYSLSMSWFDKNPDGVTRLKNNVYNCVNNLWRDIPAGEKLCGAFNRHANKIKGKGYSKSFLSFNARATNAYRDRVYLTYLVNIFMNVSEKQFYQRYDVSLSEDTYALSTMIQWIWRSAIRDGSEIYIYIPSKRMRELLINWIEAVSEGGNNATQ